MDTDLLLLDQTCDLSDMGQFSSYQAAVLYELCQASIVRHWTCVPASLWSASLTFCDPDEVLRLMEERLKDPLVPLFPMKPLLSMLTLQFDSVSFTHRFLLHQLQPAP